MSTERGNNVYVIGYPKNYVSPLLLSETFIALLMVKRKLPTGVNFKYREARESRNTFSSDFIEFRIEIEI
jgi:hypothetical protein